MLEYHKEDEALLVRNLVTGQDLVWHTPPSAALTPPPIPLPTQHNPSRNPLLPPNPLPSTCPSTTADTPTPSSSFPTLSSICLPCTHTLPTLTLPLTQSPHAAAFLMSSWVMLWFVWGLPLGQACSALGSCSPCPRPGLSVVQVPSHLVPFPVWLQHTHLPPTCVPAATAEPRGSLTGESHG